MTSSLLTQLAHEYRVIKSELKSLDIGDREVREKLMNFISTSDSVIEALYSKNKRL